jgi:acetyl-CoA carboxylase biotin carboxyl carrier protein
MTAPPDLIPEFDTIPDVDDIGQIATWLVDAGLDSLELSNEGLRLRISVSCTAASEPAPSHAPSFVETANEAVDVRAPYFGVLSLAKPLEETACAPLGASVHKDGVVAFLVSGALLIPVLAPTSGAVVDVVGQAGELIGYGATIMRLRPDAG